MGDDIEGGLMPPYETVEPAWPAPSIYVIDMNKVDAETVRWFPKMKSLVMFRHDMNKFFQTYKIDMDKTEIQILSKTGQKRTFFWKEYNIDIGARYHAPAENIDLWIIWVTIDPDDIPMKYRAEGVQNE